MISSTRRSCLYAVLLVLVGALAFGQASPYVVTTTADAVPPAAPTLGMLRYAINTRNACSTVCSTPITFAIPSSDTGCVAGVCTIRLDPAALQLIINASIPTGYEILGESQLTFGPNPAKIVIDANGRAGSGFVLNTAAKLDYFSIGGFTSGSAIYLAGTADGSIITRLQIGFDPLGNPLPNQTGIFVENGYTNTFTGGISSMVRNSTGAGIQVGTFPSDAINVRMYGLSLRDNGGLGIDLGNNGVTANDVDDADTGANGLQNFPVITAANETPTGGLHVTGTVNIEPSTMADYDIEIYGTFVGDDEAFSPRDSYTEIDPASNTITIDRTIATWDPTETAVTATATKRDNSSNFHATSEISAAVAITRSDLALTKSAPATAVAGRPVTWTLGVTNTSPEFSATTVTVTDTLPAGVTSISASGTGWTCPPPAGTVTCTAASLAASYSGTITITGVAPVGPATITNSATISASAGNRVSTNDTATTTTSLTYPDLTVTKGSSPASVARGGSVAFNINVTNGGSAGADGVQVVDTFPAGFTFVSQSGGGWDPCTVAVSTVTCVRSSTAGELPAGASAALGLTFTASTTAGSYTNNVSVAASNESNTANNGASAGVTVVNSPPVPAADTYAATEDTTLNVAAPGVLSNDTDPDLDPLTAALLTPPANGTATLAGTGALTYTPDADFNGSDSLTYEVSDGTDVAGPVTVTINVAPVNDAPLATDDAATTSEDTPITIPVLSNDTDPDGTVPTISANGSATNGTVSCTASDCTYTPDAGFNGSDAFTYTITDGSLTTTATVTVTVTAVNDPPVAVDDAYTTPEDVSFSTGSIGLVPQGVLLNDTDPDGDAVYVLSSDGPSVGTGSLIDTYGRFGVTPPPDYNGTITYTYTATDFTASSNLATVTITVTPVNDAPLAVNDSASTTVGVPVVINVLTNDTDVDGDALSVTGSTNGSLGTVVCTASGSCTYTPGSTTGTDSFTYTISDGSGGTATGTVTVVVGADPCPTDLRNLSPASGDEVAPDGALSWSGGTNADSFTVYLGPRGSGCTTFFDTTTTRRANFSGLEPGAYEWRVKANKSGCEAPPVSSCVRFTVVQPCAGTPAVLVSPAPGANVPPRVTFVWRPVATALRYHLMIATAAGTEEKALVEQPAAPLPETLSATADVPAGAVEWWVVAEMDGGCADLTSARVAFTACPSTAPEPLAPLQGAQVESSPVEFSWTGVDGATRYDLYLSVNDGAFEVQGSVAGTETDPSLSVAVPAGAALSWYVEAVFPAPCGTTRSETIDVGVACYPPVLSLQGEVTTGKPYQVRASIVSVGREYVFEESDTEDFATVRATKEGEVDPTGEFIFTNFEHEVTEPTPFFYRTRLAQQGCAYSDVGRIVVIPLPPPTATKTETVVQLGNEEEIRQTMFVPSPTPDQQTSYTFVAETDREWMHVDPAAGTIGPLGVTLTVITNPVGLPVGSNTGTVTVTFTSVAGGKQALETTATATTPVSVTLVTPVTNTGKDAPGPDSLIIPAVAHATGVNSEWQTDLRLLNIGAEATTYALNLTVSGQDGTESGKSSEIELAAGQNAALNDVVKQWYGLGSLPGESTTGVLEIRPLGPNGAGKGGNAVPVTRSLVSLASSRTYNKTANGTLGEHIPAIPFASFVGGSAPPEGGEKSVLSLQQLAQSSAYRSNLGVVEASGEPVEVEIRFFDAEGAKILTLPLSLQPGEHRQLNQVLAVNGLTDVPTARAEVEVVGGAGKIMAYASVVDNITGDPLQVSAVDLATIGAQRYVMPGIAHVDTGAARWRTDVQMFNAGLASVTAELAFYPVGASTPSKTASVEIGPGAMETLTNVLPTVFGETNTGGAIQIATATESELVITGRTYDQREEGSYGQFMAAVTEDDAIGLGDRAMQVLQMEQSSAIRSNLGLVEVTGKEVRVEISAYPAESRVTPQAVLTLKPNEFRQLNAVLKSLNAGTTYNARVALRVIGGDGKIVAYGSAVDNQTQDPTYIPGQ